MKPQKPIKQSGFTLIELIVVLAILGIILAIAVPNYMGVQAKATETADHREAEFLADTMKRAIVDGTIFVENGKLFGLAPTYNNDDEITGFKKQKFVGTGKSFDKVFQPIYYSEIVGPEAPDSDNNRGGDQKDLQRFMFAVNSEEAKIEIYVGKGENKTTLTTVNY